MAGAKRGCLLVVTLLLVLAAIVAGAGAWFFYKQSQFADVPLTPSADSMVIASGDGMNSVLRKLREAGVDEGQDTQWQLLARQLDAAGKLKVGEYALSKDLTPRELLLRMRAGKVLQHRVTIIEGWNIRQLRAALKRADPLLHTTDTLDDAALMDRLGFAGQHPEGRFLPETYVYQRGDSDLDLNILIRTAEVDGNEVSFRTGAGIVVDSDPDKELDETRAKARGLLRALGQQG